MGDEVEHDWQSISNRSSMGRQCEILRNLACKPHGQASMAENQEELAHELTAVRAQLQQVVSRLGSIEGEEILLISWHNSELP